MIANVCRSVAIIGLAISAPAFSAVLSVDPGESIQAAVNQANPGDTVRVRPGEYHETVYIDKNDLVLEGVVLDGRWAHLTGRGVLNDGVLVAGHGVTVRQLQVSAFKGNAIMTQGANNVRIIGNRVMGPAFYGIFPQYAKNGLVANNIVTGVEDAAIYVGMSENVDVIGNETFGNVMGIETENSLNMLVEGNYVHDNSAGILLTLIGGLPIKEGRRTIVRNNFVINNNLKNFAPPGTPASNVPVGLGGVVYAYDEAVWENNVFRDNDSAAIAFMDHTFIPMVPDPKTDPRPDQNRVMTNLFLNNGTKPHGVIADLAKVVGMTKGIDIFSTGKGRKNCIREPDSVSTLGTEGWSTCDEQSSENVRTMRLEQPAPAIAYDATQVGRMTYLAVCTGCHSYSGRIIGPPMVTVKALYSGRPEALAQWIAEPTRKRQDYPEMPPQKYLPENVRLAVANYILSDLRQ